MIVRRPLLAVLSLLASLLARDISADEIRVAVATNFAEPMGALAEHSARRAGTRCS